MGAKICSLCKKNRALDDSQFCKECSEAIKGALLGRTTLSVDQAENLAFLLGEMALNVKWLIDEAVELRERLEKLEIAFRDHGHLPLQGTPMIPYERGA